MQWHTHQARDYGVDVLWWTEHDGMLNQKRDYEIKLKDALITENLNIHFPKNISKSFLPSDFVSTTNGGIPELRIMTDSSFQISIKSSNAANAYIKLKPRNSEKLLSNFIIPRPISSDAKISFGMDFQSMGSEDYLKITFFLSWHYMEKPVQQQLNYIFSRSISEKKYQNNGMEQVTIYIPVPENNYEYFILDLGEDSKRLEFGYDNTISDFSIELYAGANSETLCTISNFRLFSGNPDAENQLRMVQYFSDEYQFHYNVKGISGIEYSPWRKTGPKPHLNLFLPTSIYSPEEIITVFPDDKFNYIKLIQNTKKLGGVVSFNHIFGTSMPSGGRLTVEDQKKKVDSLYNYYYENELFGASILEVGYISRGKVDLKNHLRIWDMFNANRVFCYGNGTTDAHGGLWNNPNEFENPFTTWIWSENDQDTAIVNSLKKGLFYFGTLNNKLGNFFFSIDDFNMGEIIYTEKQQGKLSMYIQNPVYNYTYRLIQVRINDENGPVEYISNKTFDPYSPPIIDLSESCFIRIELIGESQKEMVFSNPIYILKNKDQGNIGPDSQKQDNSINYSMTTRFAYPNPAIYETWIPFEIPGDSYILFIITDNQGRPIRKIDLGERSSGIYESQYGAAYWDLSDYSGHKVLPGIYFAYLNGKKDSPPYKIIVK